MDLERAAQRVTGKIVPLRMHAIRRYYIIPRRIHGHIEVVLIISDKKLSALLNARGAVPLPINRVISLPPKDDESPAGIPCDLRRTIQAADIGVHAKLFTNGLARFIKAPHENG